MKTARCDGREKNGTDGYTFIIHVPEAKPAVELWEVEEKLLLR